jgi:hypothetical protein
VSSGPLDRGDHVADTGDGLSRDDTPTVDVSSPLAGTIALDASPDGRHYDTPLHGYARGEHVGI